MLRDEKQKCKIYIHEGIKYKYVQNSINKNAIDIMTSFATLILR